MEVGMSYDFAIEYKTEELSLALGALPEAKSYDFRLGEPGTPSRLVADVEAKVSIVAEIWPVKTLGGKFLTSVTPEQFADLRRQVEEFDGEITQVRFPEGGWPLAPIEVCAPTTHL
jgi:hypothetical protein